jgi:ribonuclease HI
MSTICWYIAPLLSQFGIKFHILLKQKFHWKGLSLSDCFDSWLKDKSVPIKLVVHLCWYVWIERNQVIFEDKSPSIWAVIYKTIRAQSPCTSSQSLSAIKWSLICQGIDHILSFFDGASILKGMNCGAGGVIKFPDLKAYRWHINGGNGTNSKAELLGAWVTLTLAKLWNIPKIKVLGDSKVIIDWLNKKNNLNAIDIEGWKRRTKVLSSHFQEISYLHIYREHNKEADRLSKQALLGPTGRLTYYLWENGKVGPPHHLKLF